MSAVRAAAAFLRRVTGSRYVIALALTAVVAAAVGVGRLAGSGRDWRPGLRIGVPGTASSAPVLPDDGLDRPAPRPVPTAADPAAAPREVALGFTRAWLRHRDVDAAGWLAGLTPFATADLMRRLTGARPEGVPADRMTGEPEIIPLGTALVEVDVPVDSGLLRLRLVPVHGRWRVDTVDWERA